MRKLLIILILLFFVSTNLVYAEVKPPDWVDLCPYPYLKAEYKKTGTGRIIASGFGVLLVGTIIGFPIGYPILLASKKQYTINYWAKRHESFNNKIKSCNKLETDDRKAVCYAEVKDSELKENYYKINKCAR